jgi:hypothetical protein
MENWNNLDLTLEVDDILRGQGADPEKIRARKPALVRTAERTLNESKSLLHPAVLVQEMTVKEHRHDRILLDSYLSLTGPLVTRHLAGAKRVIAVLCTIGGELEQASNRLFSTDPLMAMAIDGLGNAAVEHLGQQICQRIADKVEPEGLTASTPLSPGEPDWPVNIGQPQLFAMVEAAKIGISLTSGGMMLPKKSISFVVGIGSEMSQADPCEVCGLRESCRYRHA